MMRSILDMAGRTLLLACATPAMVAASVRTLLEGEHERDVLLRDLARTRGANEELRAQVTHWSWEHARVYSQNADLEATVERLTESLRKSGDDFAEAMKRLQARTAARDVAEQMARELQGEVDDARATVSTLRRELKWPDGNDASWVLNLIDDKQRTIERLIRERDEQGTMP